MPRKIVYYDKDNYIIYKNRTRVDKAYFLLVDGDEISSIRRDTSLYFSCIYSSEKMSKTTPFYELAGGILFYEPISHYLSCRKIILFEENYNGNHIEVSYDGITHFKIEDDDYIYRFILDGYVDIAVAHKDNIIMLTYEQLGKKNLIILSKIDDYDELIKVSGDDIEIGETNILVTQRFCDSLGRISRSEYVLEGRAYKCLNTNFEYTYNRIYAKYVPNIIEDAIVARDYQYIAKFIDASLDINAVESYFTDVLGVNCKTLVVDVGDDNEMHFIVERDGLKSLASFNIEYNDIGKIVNFDQIQC